MTTIQVGKLEDLIPAGRHALAHFGKTSFWWRGQARSDWPLVPKVFRCAEFGGPLEHCSVYEFFLRAPTRHAQLPATDRVLEWLFLMQHYGAPTRLLDWTESAAIATYFATLDGHDDQPGALWALSAPILNETHGLGRGTLMPWKPDVLHLAAEAAKPNPARVEKVLGIRGRETDVRMSVQLCAFTLHGTPAPLESLSSSEDYLMKFEIPAATKAQLRITLDAFLGIRATTLFPDLGSLGHHLANTTWVVPGVAPSGAG